MSDITKIDSLFKETFLSYVSVSKKEAPDELKHPLLNSFKPPYYVLKNEVNKIYWYPYDLYEKELQEYYKKYYNLKTLKQSDSTLRALLSAFKSQKSYYILEFKDNSTYKVILKE